LSTSRRDGHEMKADRNRRGPPVGFSSSLVSSLRLVAALVFGVVREKMRTRRRPRVNGPGQSCLFTRSVIALTFLFSGLVERLEEVTFFPLFRCSASTTRSRRLYVQCFSFVLFILILERAPDGTTQWVSKIAHEPGRFFDSLTGLLNQELDTCCLSA